LVIADDERFALVEKFSSVREGADPSCTPQQ